MRKLLKWLKTFNAYRIAVYIGVAMTLGHIAIGGQLEGVPVLGRLENIFHDLKFHERGQRKPSGDVVIAAVDEKAIQTVGRWQWPRWRMAQMVDKLTALGAKAIVFDITYAERMEEDKQLAALLKDSAKVSLASPEVAEKLERIASAESSATGDAAAAVKLSLETLKQYRELQASYFQRLKAGIGGKSSDEQLAESVHNSGRVVLGAILLTPNELKTRSAAQTEKDIAAVKHVRVAPPTAGPTDFQNAELVSEREVKGVGFHLHPGVNPPLPELVRRSEKDEPAAISFFNTEPDADGVIRREALVFALGDPSKPNDVIYVPNIDLGAVLKYYDADNGQTRLWTNGEVGGQLEYVAVLPNSAKGGSGPPKTGDFKTIPVSANGDFILNYYGGDGSFPTISLGDVAEGNVSESQVKDKIVLVAVTAIGTYDQRTTPFQAMTPGVEVHATAIENILHNDYLMRPWWATPFEAAILLVLALLVGRLLIAVPVTWGALVTLVTLAGYHALDYVLFSKGIAVFSALPLLELSSIYIGQTIYRYMTEEQSKKQLRRTFQYYLNESVIEEMLQDPSKLKLGGDKKVLSVMFSDIRGFTTISEKLSPEGLAKMINEYLTPMTNIVFETGGTLDKYIGDALMAIWGAPVDQPDHAYRACKASVAMMRELKNLQKRWEDEGRNYPPIDIGIGINSGPMVVGNMGADQRFDYTVLGDNVNLASRLEGTNKDYRSHIIISQNTYAFVKDQVAALCLGAVRVKGKKEPVGIYELLDDKPATGEMAEVIARFNEGVALFQKQEWQAAREKFWEVLAKWPDYGPAHAYVDFVEEYEANPPGEGWDGVYTMTHK
jgi:adenylate cyclase